MLSQQGRIKWLDIARTLAILLVILNHAVELTYSFSLDGWNQYSASENFFKILLFSLGRLGVPLFLAISGVLLLNKRFCSKENILSFYHRNLVPLIISSTIWSLFYFIFLYFYYGERYTWLRLIKGILFMENIPIAHMWYIPMITGIYVTLPFLAYILQTFPIHSFYLPIGISFLSFVLLPSINVFLSVFNVENIFFFLDVSFLGGVYGLYMVCGYFIEKGVFARFHAKILFILCGISLLFTIWAQFFSYQHNYMFNTWYSFIGIFSGGIFLFELIRRCMNLKLSPMLNNLCTYLSKISLALYYLHMPVLMNLKKFLFFKSTHYLLNVIILWLLGGGISIVIIALLSNIKLIRKYILVIK